MSEVKKIGGEYSYFVRKTVKTNPLPASSAAERYREEKLYFKEEVI